MTVHFTLTGRTPEGKPSPPRTKKNSPMIVRGMKHPILLPSQAYTDWLRDVSKGPLAVVIPHGVELPIRGPVTVRALVYRERNTGDWMGYMEAVSDAIQAPIYRCQKGTCGAKYYQKPIAGHCTCGFPLKQTRKGLGIILDDKQIQYFEGVPLMIDRERPRVEVQMEIMQGPAKGLFSEEEEE